MTPDLPPNPRAELEAKVTAFLLGELSQEEAAQVREQITRDLELKRLHERLSQTLDYVREMAAAPQSETTAPPAPLRMSAERREKLLASFKTIKPEIFEKPTRFRLSVMEAIALVACVVLVASLALPHLSGSKTLSVNRTLTFGAGQNKDAEVLYDVAKLSAPAVETKSAKDQSANRTVSQALQRQAPATGIVLPQNSPSASADSVELPRPSQLSADGPANKDTIQQREQSANISFNNADPNIVSDKLRGLFGNSNGQQSREMHRSQSAAPTTNERMQNGISGRDEFAIVEKKDSFKVDQDSHHLYFRSESPKATDRGESSKEIAAAPQVSNGNPLGGRYAFPSLGGGAFQNGLAATPPKAMAPAPQAAFDEDKLGVAKNEARPLAPPLSGPSSSYAAPATTSAEVTFAIGDAPLDSRRFSTPAHGGMSMTASQPPGESGFALHHKPTSLTPIPGMEEPAAPSPASAPSVLAGGAFAAEPAPIALPSVSLANGAPLSAPTESVVVNSDAIAQNSVSGSVVSDQSRDEHRLVEGINAGVDSTIAANDQKKAKLSSAGGAGGAGLREDASNVVETAAPFNWRLYADEPAQKGGVAVAPTGTPAPAQTDLYSQNAVGYINVKIPNGGVVIESPITQASPKPALAGSPGDVTEPVGDSSVTEKPRLLEGELVKQQAAVTAMPEVRTRDNAFSTFSLNVSDASFKLAEASLQNGQMPNPADVRTEEFINAFDYRDPEPPAGAPIGFAWERAADPFAHNRDFVRLSIKAAAQGREVERPLNLVLLLDKSGSMERADRVAIIAKALDSLAAQLHPNDLVSVVIFARTPSLRVDGVPASELPRIAKELRDLTPEGGTNLEEAMKLAYQTALRHYLNNGENRVVLLTDGAANLGDTGPANLKAMAERYRKQGVNLDCFGIGWDGYNDTLLETVSRGGGGRYGFINTPEEASSELAGKLAGAFRVAAADVKVQVEFNPNRVVAYRQIGYLKDQLRKEDFRNNDVKAAQISPEESGNALYAVQLNPAGDGPIGTVHVRYRVPGTSNYEEHAWPLDYSGSSVSLDKASAAMRLATASASFAEWLAGSPYAGEVTPDRLLQELRGIPQVYGADGRPAKLEWMIRQAKSISGK